MRIVLKNDALCIVLNSSGGHIEKITNLHTGGEHYWAYDKRIWPRRTSVCFPICGGLTNDQYVYQGNTYHMPMHGFLREKELALIAHSEKQATFLLESDEATRERYPFDFRFYLEYCLEGNVLTVRYTVANTGRQSMYYSVGSHYTYRVPIKEGERLEDYAYVFDGVQKAGRFALLKNGQLGEQSGDIFRGEAQLRLAGLFENGSIILDTANLTAPVIALRNQRTGTFTEVSFEGFSHCVLWAPTVGAPFACIEPWAGMVDQQGHDGALQNKLGILRLDSQCERTCTIRIGAK